MIDDMEVLWAFGKEWQGNVKPGVEGLTQKELMELIDLYPEIWGDYVRAYSEEEGQSINTGLQNGVPEHSVGQETGTDQDHEGVEEFDTIQPSIGWHTGEVGADTYEKGL